MLWKDIKETEDCENCPLLEHELCTEGFACYGGEPIEPPCCGFDDNTDLDEWVDGYYERMRAYDAYESKRIEKERKRKERAQKAANTRREMRLYCMSEILALKRAEKALQVQKNAESFASSIAEAINFANAAFQYDERVTVNPPISEEVKRLETERAAAKQKYEAKRKEFYVEREKKRKTEAQAGDKIK